MARLTKARKLGLFLTKEELKELKEMYLSGLYYVKEICEWFGINRYQFICYMEELGLW